METSSTSSRNSLEPVLISGYGLFYAELMDGQKHEL